MLGKFIALIVKFSVVSWSNIMSSREQHVFLPTGQRQVSTGHRSLLHNDYFVNCFRLEPRKYWSWSRTKLQVMFLVVGTRPHNQLFSKVFHPFKHTYELQNICAYPLPSQIGQRDRVNRNYSEEIVALPVNFTKGDFTLVWWEED